MTLPIRTGQRFERRLELALRQLHEGKGIRVTDSMRTYAGEATNIVLAANDPGIVYSSIVTGPGAVRTIAVQIDGKGNEPGVIYDMYTVAAHHVRVKPFQRKRAARELGLAPDDPAVHAAVVRKFTGGGPDRIVVSGIPPFTMTPERVYKTILHELIHFFDPSIVAVNDQTHADWDERSMEASMSGNQPIYSLLPHELAAELPAVAATLVDRWTREGISRRHMLRLTAAADLVEQLPEGFAERHGGFPPAVLRRLREILYHTVNQRGEPE